MSAFVYILRDENGKFYIGSTLNMDRRMRAHSSGHTQTTRRMIDPTPVLIQKYETLDYARKIERKLKKLKRKDYIEKIVEVGYIKMTLE